MKKDKIAKALGAKKYDMLELVAERQAMLRQINLLKKELAENKWLFDMQHERVKQATILWRERFGRPNVSPDLGALVEWLTDRGDRWQDVMNAARRVLDPIDTAAEVDLHEAIKRYDEFYKETV